MDIEEFRKAGYAAVDAICDYYANLHQRSVKAEVEPGFLVDTLPSKAPQDGEPFNEVAADFGKLILPGITHWQHGRFSAYFPSIVTFESIIADMYSSSVSNPGFNWICSPACTELEQVVMDWMADLFGLSESFRLRSGQGGGVILNTASDAALTAAIAAREHTLLYLSKQQRSSGSDVVDISESVRLNCSQRFVIYGSTQTHSLGAKAAVVLGVTFRAVAVSRKDNYTLRGDALNKAIEEDIEAGLIPFLVIATMGTTSTGAFDRIAEIGKVVHSHPGVLLHVDAAWAGVAASLPEQRTLLQLDALNEYADFFCTNLHKWGLVGFDCSLLFTRDRRYLTDALDVTPSFLRSKEADAGKVIDYRNWQIPLGRRFRSIKIWFVMRSYGVSGFQNHLRTGISQVEKLSELVKQSDIFEIVAPPSLALLVIRLIEPADKDRNDAELNLVNTRLHNQLSMRNDVMITQTMLHSVEGDIFCLRLAFGGLRTKDADVLAVWKVISSEGTKCLESWQKEKEALRGI